MIKGGVWPNSKLKEDAPPEAVVLQKISKKFKHAVRGEGLSEAGTAKLAGISRQAVHNILNGETWMDLPTLYRIETSLNVTLWDRDDWPKPSDSSS